MERKVLKAVVGFLYCRGGDRFFFFGPFVFLGLLFRFNDIIGQDTNRRLVGDARAEAHNFALQP